MNWFALVKILLPFILQIIGGWMYVKGAENESADPSQYTPGMYNLLGSTQKNTGIGLFTAGLGVHGWNYKKGVVAESGGTVLIPAGLGGVDPSQDLINKAVEARLQYTKSQKDLLDKDTTKAVEILKAIKPGGQL